MAKSHIGLLLPLVTFSTQIFVFQSMLLSWAAPLPLGFANPSCLAHSRSFATTEQRLSPYSMQNNSHETHQLTNRVIEQYELTGTFERWSFLQKLLENELPLLDVEDVLLAVLDRYLMYGPSVGSTDGDSDSDDGNPGDASPVLDDAKRELIQRLINEFTSGIEAGMEDADSRFLHQFVQPPIDYDLSSFLSSTDSAIEDSTAKSFEDIHASARSLLNQIEQLLPDPAEDEEAHKSAWDVVIELHGRESVRVREENLQRSGLDGDSFKENLEWKTLCCIGRVLIHYDFLTKGILSG